MILAINISIAFFPAVALRLWPVIGAQNILRDAPPLVFVALFAAVFFVPGWLLLKALNLRRHRFLLAVSLSYTLLVAVLTILQCAQRPFALFAPVIASCSLVFGAIWLIRAWLKYGGAERRRIPSARFLPIGTGRGFRPDIFIPFAAVMGLLWAYLWWAGPYLELPADVWNHIERLRAAAAQLHSWQSGTVNVSLFDALARQGNAWYLIVAFLMRQSGLSLTGLFVPLTFMTVSTFCAGMFFCALAVFRPFRFSIRKKGWLAAAATLFCALTMGVSVFAYIRYYAFAPAILNYLVFLAAVLVALDWFNSRKWWTHALWLIPVLMLVMHMVHSQEVLFACFMIMALALVNVGAGIADRYRNSRPLREEPAKLPGKRLPGESVCFVKSLVIAALTIIVWLGLFFWLRQKNPVIWPTSATIMPNMPTPAITVPLVFRALTISPPAHPVLRLIVYQFYVFYQTIGCWGFFVYLLFLLGFRQVSKSHFLLAGMFSPLLTVFNPITIDLFVRLVTWQQPGMPPVTLGRFTYMLPLPMVAAFALGSALESLRLWMTRRNVRQAVRHSALAGLKAMLVISGLIGLIFPVQNRWIAAPFSRVFTLVGRFGNDAQRWQDLTDFIAGFVNPMLVTDPETGLLLARLYPQFRQYGLQWMDANDPEPRFRAALAQHPELRTNGLVIINRRSGVPSVTGRISMHWPEDAFLPGRFYTPRAIAFVESQASQFRLIWARDRIAVFQVIP